ncbi:hypothetical protein OCS65_19420 [Rhodococcus aetherivorans]|uniref:Uncharacterized protein n=1 Tax=Rhodococcus aetherivorans TaxID=191292 RepID=A0AA46SC30_9NOCA|nr:hypothetical protein [Rhodococcus aetherivorans]UYF92631.1 hypothetical protein OCS65_19420 [Rhodococcus aetherivorans]
MISAPILEGPAWCAPGLDTKGSRFPLRVEAPVMNLVDALVPGVSTMTSNSRYYSLYWALADYAHDQDFDTLTCRTVLRRAEVALALASLVDTGTGGLDGPGDMHGADTVRTRLLTRSAECLADVGEGSYSPRVWGFWSQYKGPVVTLGIASTDREALRRGPRATPDSVKAMFRPFLDLVADRPVTVDDAADLIDLTRVLPDSADVAPLRAVMTATESGGTQTVWTANDRTRRSTFRILARAVQLQPSGKGWTDRFFNAVAYGSALDGDPVLAMEGKRAQTWRGLLLRHHSVGAWRRLWSALVDQVVAAGVPVARQDLHEWIRGSTTDDTVEMFLRGCPDPFDAHGHPAPAEVRLRELREPIEADLGVLLLGSLRDDQLTGVTQQAFRGHAGRGRYLDPRWVAHQRREHLHRPLSDFACTLVDDMLAQSHRVALLKMHIDGNGRMKLPTKLHERNGRYFADNREGSGNVGLRLEQLGGLGTQLGLFDTAGERVVTTERAATLLELPR